MGVGEWVDTKFKLPPIDERVLAVIEWGDSSWPEMVIRRRSGEYEGETEYYPAELVTHWSYVNMPK